MAEAPVRRGRVVIVSGPPGAGKSTVSRLVARHFDLVSVIESDWWWTTITAGHVAPWEPAADQQNRTVVHSYAAAAMAMAAGGYTTVLDGIVGPWMLDLVVAEAVKVGTPPVHYVVLRPDLEVGVARAMGRTSPPGDDGPSPLTDEGPIRALWRQFEDLGEYERHVIDNTAMDAEETAARVDAAVDGGRHLVGMND